MPKQLAGSNTASHVLVLPTDNPTVTARLALKLNEYQRRYDPNRAPEQQMGTLCKTAVLSRLLSEQRVVTWDLCRELRATYGSGFDPDAFSNACRVIADYYTTGGERNRGGTGAPSSPCLHQHPAESRLIPAWGTGLAGVPDSRRALLPGGFSVAANGAPGRNRVAVRTR